MNNQRRCIDEESDSRERERGREKHSESERGGEKILAILPVQRFRAISQGAGQIRIEPGRIQERGISQGERRRINDADRGDDTCEIIPGPYRETECIGILRNRPE